MISGINGKVGKERAQPARHRRGQRSKQCRGDEYDGVAAVEEEIARAKTEGDRRHRDKRRHKSAINHRFGRELRRPSAFFTHKNSCGRAEKKKPLHSAKGDNILSQSDFTGGYGISPYRLMGLSDSSARSGITAGWVKPTQRISLMTAYSRPCRLSRGERVLRHCMRISAKFFAARERRWFLR